uniref:Uncharacterized protein n=1 Tax=Anguilla anguilla TaxID=7936 RepID=A0A0E9QG85_ANGAN
MEEITKQPYTIKLFSSKYAYPSVMSSTA